MIEKIDISDASIAEIIRVAMPEAKAGQKGLMGDSGFLSSHNLIIDANTIIKSGTYMTNNMTLNAASKTWGTLIVFESNYVIQIHIIVSTSSPSIHFRSRILEVWSPWKSISIT